MGIPLRVLLVEDSERDAALVLRALAGGGFDASALRVDSADAMRAALSKSTWDVVLSDHVMPQFSSSRALTLVHEAGLDLPFIIVSGHIGEELAVAAMRAGCRDFVSKENLARLAPVVQRELEELRGRRQRRSLENQLLHAQKMEVVGLLAGGIAHDFNNLLTAIFGYTEFARDTLPPGHPARESLERVTEAAEQAAGVSRALLTFSRRLPAQKSPVQIDEVVRRSLRLLERLLPATIRLESALACPPEFRIQADPTQLQQLVINLAINARDAMPQGGTLHVGTRGRPAAPPDAPHVELLVRDTGVGMSDDVRQRIFEPFFTTKPKGVGTGLGLSIIDSIVRDHGGTIAVDSAPGQGAAFTVTLPAHVADAAEPLPSAGPPQRGSGELIVLAEDNEHVRAILAAALENAGYRVLQVGDGAALLETLRQRGGEVRVLVTDMEMPQHSGLACVTELRRTGSRVPAILITGSVGTDLEDGLDADTIVLRKPFALRTLVEFVGQRRRTTPTEGAPA
jgi:signal transduction histidine kinase